MVERLGYSSHVRMVSPVRRLAWAGGATAQTSITPSASSTIRFVVRLIIRPSLVTAENGRGNCNRHKNCLIYYLETCPKVFTIHGTPRSGETAISLALPGICTQAPNCN